MSETGTFWLPPASSTVAGEVDGLFYFIYWICVVSFILVVGATFWFAWAYRKREGGPPVKQTTHSTVLEITWSVIPGIILMVIFAWGFKGYMTLVIPPGDAMVVHVTAKKWSWAFTYPDGKIVPGELHVPVDTPVKLIMNSEDVLHSFFVPEFRIKNDVIPGRYTTAWFESNSTGKKQVFCTEYCGDQHSGMLAQVVVHSEEDFEKWMASDPYEGLSLVERGEKSIGAQGCLGCHSLDGSKGVGPTFAGVWGRNEKLNDGSELVVDADYIRNSIRNPAGQVVEGYAPVMPVYTDAQLSEQNILGIIEYLKTVN